MTLLRTIMGSGLAAAMAMTPMAAFADQSLGVYQTKDHLEDYDVYLCGSAEKNLCVKLVKLRGKANQPKFAKFIGTDIIDNAAPTGTNKWHGSVTYKGVTAAGDAVLVPGTSLNVNACAYVVICASIQLVAKK